MSKAEVGGWPDGAVAVQQFESAILGLDAYDDGVLILRWEDIRAEGGDVVVPAGECLAFPSGWIHVGSDALYVRRERHGAVIGRVLELAGHPGRPWICGFHPGGVTEIA